MTEAGPQILIVDDEKAIRRFLHASLTAHGYIVHEAEDGSTALEIAAEVQPNAIILDLGLPDITGIEVTRRIREWTETPIVILSVQGGEADKIAALDAGADDYLTKPFGIGELLARLRAALRHAVRNSIDSVYTIDNLTVDLARRMVTLGDEEVHLTPIEYNLLRLLVINAGKVITHRQLLQQVWGEPYQEETHLLRVNISNLRSKIEPEPARPHYVLTEPGVGYRLRTND